MERGMRIRTKYRRRRRTPLWPLVLSVAVLMLAIMRLMILTRDATPVPTDANVKNASRIQIASRGGGTYGYPNIMTLHDARSGVSHTLGLEEYVLGVLAAEMPAMYETEALKAQAVAARTLTVYKMRALGGAGCARDEAADVCTDSAHCQAYLDEAARRALWGASAQQYEARLLSAVMSTRGQVVTYGGAPIEALFHSTSGGRTEDSAEVFSTAVDYLRSVPSDGEAGTPRFESEKCVTREQFKEAFPSAGIDKSAMSSQVEIISRTPSGRVRWARVGGQKMRGTQLRAKLSLNSTNFTIAPSKDEVVFSVTGYGHGVGMSQTGANAMAQAGRGYAEILTWYYTGTRVVGMGELTGMSIR